MSAPAPARSERPRVLVVDDEPDDVLIARRALGERFEVEALGSAARALERLRVPPPFDLVVLDYRLGDMNALTFLRAAREGDGTRTPVIVVSGRDDPRVAAAARELGAFAFVPKDAFGRGALARTAQAALDTPTASSEPGPQRQSEVHASVLARMSEGLYAADSDGVVVLANRALERLLGYGPRELLGLGLERVMGPEALGAVAGCLARGEAFVETELRGRSGGAVPVIVSPSPLRDPGGHLAVVRDDRDLRRRMGALEDANRKLREGLAEVAVIVLHNVGNAVASLDVRSQDLERELDLDGEALRVIELASGALAGTGGAAPPREKELLELLLEATRSLAESRHAAGAAVAGIRRGIDHVARIVEHARAFAGRTRAGEARLDLAGSVETACALVQDIARGRGLGVEITWDVPSGAPPLPIPEAGFEQLLVNLLKNAIESVAARQARDPAAESRVQVVARAGPDRLDVEVRDTGQGATPEVAARAFEFGFTTRAGGSGFGLHASAEFVERLGGEVSLVSAGVDRGATVRVSIPLSPVPAGKPGEAGSREGKAAA